MLNELSGPQHRLHHTRIPATTTAEITEMVEESEDSLCPVENH